MTKILSLNVLTSRPLHSKDEGRELLQLWVDTLSDYIPERFGNYEPERLHFAPDDLESALQRWEWPFLVKRRKPKMRGSIFMNDGGIPVHGWITIGFDWQPSADQNQIIEFFKRVSTHFDAEFGCLHVADQKLRVTSHGLKQYIPDLYWATILGKPYVELFGRQKISSSPAQQIQELSRDLFYLQVSEDLNDLELRSNQVNETQEQIKRPEYQCFL